MIVIYYQFTATFLEIYYHCCYVYFSNFSSKFHFININSPLTLTPFNYEVVSYILLYLSHQAIIVINSLNYFYSILYPISAMKYF